MNTLTSRPSRIRWLILALLFLISVVTYIDRVNISVAARQMMPAYGMTDQQMGWIFSAFVVGYALFQIPGGWLADRWGVRVVPTLALPWWSSCPAFTPLGAAALLAGRRLVIGFLVRDPGRGGCEPSEVRTVSLPVSKATIASLLSLTPEYFSRVVHDLESRGLIDIDRRDIRIMDAKRLTAYQLEAA